MTTTPGTVGVLLPLRLETRFFPPEGDAGWTMRVRIVPDAPSLDRFQPVPTATELDAVEGLWRDTGGDLTTPEGIARWNSFAAVVGAARAAWLARTFPAVPAAFTIARPAATGEDLASSRVVGLPGTLELWAARGGGAPALLTTLTIDETRLSLDFPDPASGEPRWWTSFEEAVAVGLGAVVDLGPSPPDDLDVLYVVGLGDDDPADLLGDHRDAGELGVLALGTPTNAVDGEPAADLARDPETWRQLLLLTNPQAGTGAVSLALTGSATTLGPLPGGDASPAAVNHALVAALWPALWGHALSEVWGLDTQARELGAWAAANLVPEGPVPPIRIGDQPYGVLPLTPLSRVAPAPGDPPIEQALVALLATLRDHWVLAAEGAGTSEGAGTDRLLELVAHPPSSVGYAWRHFLPLELVHGLTWGFGTGVRWWATGQFWSRQSAAVTSLGAAPQRRYATLGWPQDLPIPLVVPDNVAAGVTIDGLLARLAAAAARLLATTAGQRELAQPWPDSLLYRLCVQSLVISGARVVAGGAGVATLLDPVSRPATTAARFASLGAQFVPTMLGDDEASGEYRRCASAIRTLAALTKDDVASVERAFRAALDAASHRLDPWIIGLAWRRLQALAAAPAAGPWRLGAYGWVDAPHPRTVEPFPPEFLHAPSDAQALTSALLRDRALNDPEAQRWQIDVDSASVRLADELAAEVRLGSHLGEVLGRAVERAVADPVAVAALRTRFPLRTEHAGRRVCDGQAVLAADPTSLGLDPPVLEALAALTEALDTYGDLLVADGVYQVMSGRPALAATSMDAAAGLAPPPSLDVLRTGRSGRAVATTVLVALPSVPGPTVLGATVSPAAVADPAVAAFLTATVGDPAGPAWRWTVDDGAGTSRSVTLSELGLEPIDTLGLSAAELVRAVQDEAGGGTVTPAGALDAYDRCRRLSDVLGHKPALPADVAVDAAPGGDSPVQADLVARYSDALAVAAAVRAELVGAPDDPACLVALRHARGAGASPRSPSTIPRRRPASSEPSPPSTSASPVPRRRLRPPASVPPSWPKPWPSWCLPEAACRCSAGWRRPPSPPSQPNRRRPAPPSCRTGWRWSLPSAWPWRGSRRTNSARPWRAEWGWTPGRTGPATPGRSRRPRSTTAAWWRRAGCWPCSGRRAP